MINADFKAFTILMFNLLSEPDSLMDSPNWSSIWFCICIFGIHNGSCFRHYMLPPCRKEIYYDSVKNTPIVNTWWLQFYSPFLFNSKCVTQIVIVLEVKQRKMNSLVPFLQTVLSSFSIWWLLISFFLIIFVNHSLKNTYIKINKIALICKTKTEFFKSIIRNENKDSILQKNNIVNVDE